MPITLNGTTGIVGPDGSAATPSLAGADTNTGVFFPAGDTGAIATGGTEAMRVNSSQNVGIGTSSPSGISTYPTLDVRGASGGGFRYGSSTANGYLYSDSNGAQIGSGTNHPLVLYTNGTERARIDSTGNFSITQAPGKYTVDTSGGATSIANGGTVNFPNASGMLVANNWANGNVTIYLCGGGVTTAVGSVGGQVGTLAYNGGIGGYTWTNNYGSTTTFGFFFVRTRITA